MPTSSTRAATTTDCGCSGTSITSNANGGPLLSGVLAPQYAETGGGDGVVVSQADVAQADLLTGLPAGKLCLPCVVFWVLVAGVAWYALFERNGEEKCEASAK